jgi:ABC-type transport system involved in cytochrome bd biosynthesis fused ATPase/permease subunit
MKIIGIQILNGTNIAIRKSLNLGWYPLVKCENDLALDDKALPIVAKDYCPDRYYTIDTELPSISVSAIAGKNGSGKSSLLEIIYRILNNFAATLLSPISDDNSDIEVLYYRIRSSSFF